MGIPGIPTHYEVFHFRVCHGLACRCLGYIDDHQDSERYVWTNLHECLSTFASIACEGPGAYRKNASTRRANPFRSYSYLPNDISARNVYFAAMDFRLAHIIYSMISRNSSYARTKWKISRWRGFKGTRGWNYVKLMLIVWFSGVQFRWWVIDWWMTFL